MHSVCDGAVVAAQGRDPGGLPDPQNPLIAVLIDSAHSFLQLFTSVVLFRLFMLISELPDKRSGAV